ncbi:MAG: AraC family transcriptional regulator [Ruminococcaceae bacterium]|nr:AraC family transcriptional regulator [Oscillospiraceae bacterium]
MAVEVYESHIGTTKQDFPVIFHYNKEEKGPFGSICAHWHENLELLYVVSGRIQVMTDGVSIFAAAGQVAVVNSSHVHVISSEEQAAYYCLIIDHGFLSSFGFDIEKTIFERRVDSEEVRQLFRNIIYEIDTKEWHYEAQVRADVVSLLVCLTRNHIDYGSPLEDSSAGHKLAVVKTVLQYLQRHYKETLTLAQIAEAAGFNKYYLSHLFKETMGCSMVQYLNQLRCNQAKNLLMSERYTVSEVAEMCGFENLSYFSRTYKKYMSVTPRAQKQE